MLEAVLKTLDSRREETIAGLKEFLAIPSVSAKPDHGPQIARCAQWVADKLKAAGLDVKVYPSGGGKGAPIVVGKNKPIEGRPTVLFYGHYDVQPPEPLDLWTTPAFEPTIRDGAIYARGAADDKGQVWAHIEAVAAWQKHGGIPVNLTMLIEGEEEVGSANLEAFVAGNRDLLQADIGLISDTNQFARGVPAIACGLRGLVYMEVTVTGVSHDLHSGLFGGAVPNAANVLCDLLATLHDKDGRVNIPGFYDKVIPLSTEERMMWAKLPMDEKQFAAELGFKGATGEVGYNVLEQIWARPTCDINGLSSGWEGPGAKTVIPSKATAKVSMRLVAEQDPEAIRIAFTETLKKRCPGSVKLDVTLHSHTPAVLVPLHSPAMELACEAVEVGFGVRPALIRAGGSVPIVSMLKSALGIDTLLVGFGLPDDRVHSPNEKFALDSLHAGTRTAAALYERLARLEGVH